MRRDRVTGPADLPASYTPTQVNQSQRAERQAHVIPPTRVSPSCSVIQLGCHVCEIFHFACDLLKGVWNVEMEIEWKRAEEGG